MKKFVCCYWLLFVISGCAGIPDVVLPYKGSMEVNINTILIENTLRPEIQIKGTQYIFPFAVEKMEVDTAGMKVLVLTRKTRDNPQKDPGILICYDLSSNEVLWSVRSFAWNPKFFDDKIILQGNGKVFALNKKSGNRIWERNGNCFLYDPAGNLGFSGSITAFSLDTGKDIWHREITNKFGWDEFMFCDSVLVVACNGLHTFNLNTGKGWDIEMVTGKTNRAEVAAANISMAVLSIMSGAVMYSYLTPNIWTDMNSNLIFKDNKFFYSARSRLICADYATGKQTWQAELPENKTAATVICAYGDNVMLVNKGSCLKDSHDIKYGKPFIAGFVQSTGKQLFFKRIDSPSAVKDVYYSSNGFCIITDDTFLKYDLNGNVIAKVQFDEDNTIRKYGNFLFLSGDYLSFANYYIYDGFTYKLLSAYLDTACMPVALTSKGLLVFNRNFGIEHWFPLEQIFYPVSGYPVDILYKSDMDLRINQLLDISENTMKIMKKSGFKRSYRKAKAKHQKILDENDEYLNYFHVIDHTGNYKGKVRIESNIAKINDYIYYKSNNSLVLIPIAFFE